MTKKLQADAEEAVQAPGADQEDHSKNADFGAAFDDESVGTLLETAPDGALTDKVVKPEPPKEDKPVEPEKPRDPKTGEFVKKEDAPKETEGGKEEKPEAESEAAPKTAAEKAEEAAKALDEKPPVEEEPQSNGDILDALPREYAWAKDARESGKLAEFIKAQPKAVQKMATSGDLDDAMYVLDLMKKAQEPAPATQKEMKSLLAQFGDVKFMAPDGTEKTLKSIAEEYENHELFEAFAAMAKAMAGNQAPAQKSDVVDALQQRIDRMAQDQAFWEPILEVHPDARRLVRSGKVREWIEAKGTDALKRLFRSPNPDHGVLVMDAYKEAMAKEAAAPAAEAASAKKKSVDDLHGHTVTAKRGTKTLQKKDGDEDPGAFDDGFNEGLK